MTIDLGAASRVLASRGLDKVSPIIVREFGIEEVEAIVHAVMRDWVSFTDYSISFDGGHHPPKWPRVKYLRKHIVAAVNWLPRWQEAQRRDAERLAQDERAKWAREAEECRLPAPRNRSFGEVYREKLDEAVTPGTEVHKYVSDFMWDGMPRELEGQILYQRAVAEAKQELGQRHGTQDRELTKAEREAYLTVIQGD